MDDNNGCGCYLILMGIGLLGWIVSGISEDNSGRMTRMTRGQVLVTPRESLTKIPYENALEYLAFGKDLIGDRLRLDIFTRIFTRIFN